MALTPRQQIAVGAAAIGLFGYVIWRCFLRPAPDPRGVYERLEANGNYVPTNAQALAWPATPGGLAVNNNNLGVLGHNTMLAFSNRLHATMANGNRWEWQGSSPDGSEAEAARLMDGAVDRGQCLVLARALKILLTYGAPYGYNQAANQFDISIYPGQYNQGFISTHQNTPLGLDPNIYNPGNGNTVNFQLWANHQTVEYNNRFYDPSYATTQGGLGFYNAEATMAQAQIHSSIDFQANQFPNNFVIDIVKTDNNAPNLLKGFYIQCSRNLADNHLAANFAEMQGGGFTNVWIGPFNPGGNGGNVGNNFGFDATVDYLNGVQLN